MSHCIIPQGYQPKLTLTELQTAIKLIKDTFQKALADSLNLSRVTAPLFVRPESGLNDALNGVERPVKFDIKDIQSDVEIVQSLAKWKRFALWRYKFDVGRGLYTDMNAIRRDEILDNIHSVYVDQWDWEKIISKEQRCTEYLHDTVRKIIGALYITAKTLEFKYPQMKVFIKDEVKFMTSQELEDEYPNMSPKEREVAAAEKYGIVFIQGIGGKLKSGGRHDGRSPDYDDWELNGDIIVWNPILGREFEISSMGIRVDAQTLESQLHASGCEDRRNMTFHKMVLDGTLPYTIGGGIGQSRLCMLLLQTAHIGEVQVSVWPEEFYEICDQAGVTLL